MGIDYSGGMIVGNIGDLLPELDEKYDGDIYEWVQENDMSIMCQYFDADISNSYVGFSIKDVLVSEINDEWISTIKKIADKFESLTGVPAKLIGTQDIY